MTSQQWPFDSAESEFAALLAKMTSEQRAEYRKRVIEGKIRGDWTWLDDCGCAYGTFFQITDTPPENWYAMYTQVRELWKSNDTEFGTLSALELKVANIRPGQTPADNEASAWLIAQMDAFENQ